MKIAKKHEKYKTNYSLCPFMTTNKLKGFKIEQVKLKLWIMNDCWQQKCVKHDSGERRRHIGGIFFVWGFFPHFACKWWAKPILLNTTERFINHSHTTYNEQSSQTNNDSLKWERQKVLNCCVTTKATQSTLNYL